MDQQEARNYHMKFILFLVCLLFVVVCILEFNFHTYRLPIFEGNDTYQETNWMFGEKGQELSPTKLEDQHYFEPDTTYVLSTTLTYNGEGDTFPSALLTVGNYEIRVYLDGELMFQYTKAERGYPRMKSMGGANVSIPLGRNCQGRELLLELENPMDYAYDRRMPGIQFGDFAAHMERLFFDNLPSMFISMAIFFVAVVLVILGNSTPGKRWAYLFFALFAMVIVVYRGSQDLFFMFMWANPIASVTLEFFSLVVCPLPVVLSYRHELKPYFGKSFNLLIAGSVLNIAAQLFMHFMGIRDVVQNLPLTHSWILICAVSLVLMAFRVRKLDPKIHCMRKLIPILVGAAIDFVIFYIKFNRVGPGSFFMIGDYIGLGVLASLTMLIWEARMERERSFAESERNAVLEKVAYVDTLTGIRNRASFTKEIEEISGKNHGNKSVLAVEADLNDLKKTNDNLGHAAGDDLIRRAANLLEDCFGKYGHVFRTGGDEFYILMYGVTEAQWEDMHSRFDQELKSRNTGSRNPLSIAVGHAFMDDTIEKCIQQADKQMYIDKDRIKQSGSYGFSKEQ